MEWKAEHRRRLHAWLMAFWTLNLALVWFLPVRARIAYLIVVSIYANLANHWAAYSAETPVEVQE